MKKQFLKLGTALDKSEQRRINGGSSDWCQGDADNHGLPAGCACVSDTNCIMGECDKGPFNMFIWGECK